jgi:lipoate-protein ligase B
MIVPCGMPGLHLTSIEEETGHPVVFHDVSRQTQRLFFAQLAEIF